MTARLLFGFLVLGAVRPAAAQWRTGQVTVLGAGAYAPAVPNGPGWSPDYPPPGKDGMAGFNADLSFVVGRFSMGPEFGYFHGDHRRVLSVGGVTRWELAGGRLRPHAAAGGGAYFWDRTVTVQLPPGNPFPAYPQWAGDDHYFTLNAGGGVTAGTPDRRFSAVAEVRAHRSFMTRGAGGQRVLLTIALGGRVAW
ncbi:MAG: hypothetical protein HOP28_00115 [Gemmatimonadales bacterium]|nr:hypothetical protein [Gemmatimonadales bacterium]